MIFYFPYHLFKHKKPTTFFIKSIAKQYLTVKNKKPRIRRA